MTLSKSRLLLNTFLIVASLSVAGFSLANRITASELIKNHAKLSTHIINVKGYLLRTELDGFYLFQSEDHGDETQVNEYLDMVPNSNASRTIFDSVSNGCVVVGGIFRDYSDKFYGSGYLTSNIGILYVDKVEICK